MFPHTQYKYLGSQIFFVESTRMFMGQENVGMQVKYFIWNPNFANKIYAELFCTMPAIGVQFCGK